MSADNQELAQEDGQESTVTTHDGVDFDFLSTQTAGDVALERDVLTLYLAQARRILSTLSTLDAVRQAEAAHLLRGSARGIGAWRVAEAAARYEAAKSQDRHHRLASLAGASAAAESAIVARLARLDA